MTEKVKTEKVKIISAESDPRFHELDINRIVVEIPKQQQTTNSTKGMWVIIKYKFDDNEPPSSLDIQTSELFSNGLYKHNDEEKCPIKFSLVMTNRASKIKNFSNEQTENEKENSKVEEKTIEIFKKIEEKVKEEMLKPEMTEALKKKDKGWKTKIENMEILKLHEKEGNEYQTFFLNAKLSNLEWFRTKFYKLNENGYESLDYEETKNNFLQNKTKCYSIVIVTLESVFVGIDAYFQIKLKQAMITKIKNYSSNEPEGIIPLRIVQIQKKNEDIVAEESESSSDSSDSEDDK
jgi:hypothetical protein